MRADRCCNPAASPDRSHSSRPVPLARPGTFLLGLLIARHTLADSLRVLARATPGRNAGDRRRASQPVPAIRPAPGRLAWSSWIPPSQARSPASTARRSRSRGGEGQQGFSIALTANGVALSTAVRTRRPPRPSLAAPSPVIPGSLQNGAGPYRSQGQ